MTVLHKKVMSVKHFLKKLSLRTKVIAGVSLCVLLSYTVLFLIPKPIDYAYGGDDCVQQLTLFPESMKQTTASGFVVSFEDGVSIAQVPLLSTKTCVTAHTAPKKGEEIVRVSPFGLFVGVKHYKIAVQDPPVARTSEVIGKTLPLTRPLTIGLSKGDQVFSYGVSVGDKTSSCEHKNGSLSCDLQPLTLEQGQEYTLNIHRSFKKENKETLAEGKIKTLQALVLQAASVTPGQVIYDKPTEFTFQYDKQLAKASAELKQRVGDALEVVPTTTTTKDSSIIVTPKKELARNTSFELTLQQAEADDGSGLSGPYVTPYTMSGGPKVTGVSARSSGMPTSGVIVVTLDQEVANTDTIPQLVTVQGMSASVAKSGNTLRITYAADKCAGYAITVKKGLESTHGVAQQEDWSFAGRTQCYTLRTIGASKQGRPITAYIFGSGGNTILYTGAIHGNEHSSRLLMNAWINEIEANPQNIPTNTQLIVIPSVNPDGVAASTRYNSAGVDLNRNFGTSDWRSDVETVNGKPLPGGGGASPGSEPETQALMNFTQSMAPSLTMSYHAAAAYVIANTCGNTGSLASKYASMVGYRNMTGVSGAFAYQITGTYDDWICERLGRRSVLVELTTNSNAEFARHKAALWEMARS